MHCADPGCLKACPAPGAIVQYTNGIVDFIHENCIGCGYCVKGCPFNIPRISQTDHKRLQVHPLLRPRGRRPGPGLRQGLPDPGHRLRHQGGHEEARGGAHHRPEVARLRQCRPLRSAGRGRHACDVRAAPRGQAGHLLGPAGQPAHLAARRDLEGHDEVCRPGRDGLRGGGQHRARHLRPGEPRRPRGRGECREAGRGQAGAGPGEARVDERNRCIPDGSRPSHRRQPSRAMPSIPAPPSR
jgi:Fe-S-cluster-containing hydrogenase component 2